MRFSQPLLVFGLVGVVAALGLCFVAFRSASSHRDVMLGALQSGMERVYDQAVAEASRSKLEEPILLSASVLRTVLLDTREQRPLLPSFVDSHDVFLPQESVPIPSGGLVCVVRVDGSGGFGITGQRAWREVSPAELAGWPHEPLSTNRPATR